MTHEKQVEANATLDVNGVYGAIDPVNKWTKVLKYDAFGRLTEGTDARGVKTTFSTYDTLNRIKVITFSDGTPQVTYTYDQARSGFFNNGVLTRVETAQGGALRPNTPATVAEFDYDLMGRVVKHRQTIDTQQYNIEYGYNLAGQLTSEKYPSGKIVSTGYDANGRLATVADPSRTYLSGMQYLGKGNSMSQMNLGNGNTETFTLNDRLQMTSQSLNKGAEVLQKYDYSYGTVDLATGAVNTAKNNGQLGKVESFIGANKQASQRFAYDELGRLSESREYRGDNNSLTYKQKFDFDRFGNLYRKAGSNPTPGQANPLAYTPIEATDISKATNRFTTNTTYDDAGQVTTDNKFRTMSFAYDANGRQVKATRASVPDAWTVYDAGGNRVATKINDVWQYVVYDAFGKLVAEYGVVSEGLGGVKYVQQDWQGSVRTVVNNNGFVVGRTDHQAFGNDVGYGVGQRSVEQGYSVGKVAKQGYGMTERDDATGLDHTWFIKNENQAGRWTSPDPYNGSMNLGDPQSFNRYSYVTSDPVNYVDPSGLLLAIPQYECHTVIRFDRPERVCEFVGYSYVNIGSGPPNPTSGGEEFPSGVGGSTVEDKLPFNSCAEFVDYLVGLAVKMGQKAAGAKSKAKTLGKGLMYTAYFEYDRHSKNGYEGFKGGLVNAGAEVNNPQGGNVYAHILAFAGAYLDSSNALTYLGSVAANQYDHGQIITGNNPQAPSEVAGNAAGTSVGTHIWNFLKGNGSEADLKTSITSELCDKK
jgi:RHS repeat-associated protein